jgi:hypothetical protein
VIPLVGAEVDRSDSLRRRSCTGGEDDAVIEKGREKEANAVDRLELDLRAGLTVGSGDVDKLFIVVLCLERVGGVFPVEKGVTAALGTITSLAHGPFEEPKEP